MQFTVEANQKAKRLIFEAEEAMKTNQNMVSNILKKAAFQLDQQSDLSNDVIHKTITSYYELLRRDNTEYGKNIIFWLSNESPHTIIDQSSIECYSDQNEKFANRKKMVESSETSNFLASNIYTYCKNVGNKSTKTGTLCIFTQIDMLLSKLMENQTEPFVLLHYYIDNNNLKFSVKLKNPVYSYFVLTLSDFFYFVLAWFLGALAYFHGLKLLNNRRIKERNEKNSIEKQLAYLTYLSSASEDRTDLLFHTIQPSRYQTLSEKDIDLVVNYFHKEINDNKAILRCNVSESLKQVKCDVLLLQRLLSSVLVEGLHMAMKCAEIYIIFDRKGDKVSLIYRDNNYACDFDTSSDQLKNHPFFIEKPILNRCVSVCGGSIYNTYVKYESKQIEILLPCVQIYTELNVIPIANIDNKP